ncbi:bifunctional Calcium load-activated calcium channel/Integral membrane protein EMC3-TMCO1-like [Babesia duncani]|uniref:Bifunctional Calcium load-activated calcium channel/Integral membrane protein EMC3-TMCO1-like n=1 Tax=Babesia duncani TaxID=323732 RepID=A0AAD9PKN0_9APIC|nr:bifunctional Calcium load-activated calcium channel/Integral membrane protein EMC3-TMCO1-like [Babesia duncani]
MDTNSIVGFEKRDLFLVISFSILSAVAKEVIGWFFIYRKSEYKIKHERLCKAYDNYCEAYVKFDGSSMTYNDCAESVAFSERLREFKGNWNLYTMATGFIFMILMVFVMSYFEGALVAKLPFTPIKLLGVLTKGDIPGNDYTDCSATCIYTILSLITKDAIQMFLGYHSPVSMIVDMLTMASDAEREKEKKN